MPRDVDRAHLHPAFRALNDQLQAEVTAAGIPIAPFEMWRDPNRQAYLYAEGRTGGIGTPGHHVTFESAWCSLHQFGLACDWVWRDASGAWSWAPPSGFTWDQFHALAAKVGLVYLNFEQPHVQLAGISARDILAGKVPYPPGGDDSWEQNIEAAIVAWGRSPKVVDGQQNAGAPPLPSAAMKPPVVAA